MTGERRDLVEKYGQKRPPHAKLPTLGSQAHREAPAMTRNAYPMVQIRPLTVTEWEVLRSVLHHAGQVHQAVSTGPSGVLRIDQLPSTFAAVLLAVTEASSVEPTV